jgi:hypothetical protein
LSDIGQPQHFADLLGHPPLVAVLVDDGGDVPGCLDGDGELVLDDVADSGGAGGVGLFFIGLFLIFKVRISVGGGMLPVNNDPTSLSGHTPFSGLR